MTGRLAFLNIGFAEMIVVGVIALLVFGERLPQALRTLGRTYANVRRSLQEATRPVREEMARAEREVTGAPPTQPYPSGETPQAPASEPAQPAPTPVPPPVDEPPTP
jgi:sec-independent protein translocase protein TatA